ncbi:hypothetical protein GCM10023063_20120 [Arthrobacter methylotrophus]
MVEDMLEAEIETLWRQGERAYWVRNTPDFALTRLSAFGGLTVVLLFTWPVVEVFRQKGFFAGVLSVLFVVGIWAFPVTVVEEVRKRRRSRRPAPGSSPDSAEDLRYLRELQQRDVVKVGDRFWPPNLKVFDMWMREGGARASERQRTAERRQSLDTVAKLNMPLIQERKQRQRDDEDARLERIRILLSPHSGPNGNGASSCAKPPGAAGNGKTPGRFSGTGSDS